MRAQFNSPVSPLLVAGVVGVIFLVVIAWVWAVRRPAPVFTSVAVSGPTATSTKPPVITYAAIGASDVVGVGANDPATESWVNLLYKKMPPGTHFARLGRSGITLQEANVVEIPDAIARQPDIITLWNCVNDVGRGVPVTTYISELNTALTRLTKETEATVLLLDLPDISLLLQGKVPDAQRDLIKGGVQQWNKEMRVAAAAYGDRVKFVDIFPASEEILLHPEYLSSDEFHPSTVGYQRLADFVWDVIQKDDLLGNAGS